MPLVVTSENQDAVIADLRQQRLISVDTETTGLTWKDRPFLAIIATDKQEYLFPLPGMVKAMASAMEFSWHRTVVFQNAKFDLRMLAHLDLSFLGPSFTVVDTNVMARLVKNDHMEYSLKAQAKRVLKKEKLDDVIKEHIKKNNLYEIRTLATGETVKQPRYDRVPTELMYEYAAMDARLTYDLHQEYMRQLDASDLKVLDNESWLTKVCFWMEWHGIRVDLDYTAKARGAALLDLSRAKQRFQALTGLEFADSKKLLIPLFQNAGEKIAFTEKGNPRLTDEDLARFQSPAAQAVRDIREQQKLISTYYDNFLNMAEEDRNGFHVIHPTMWQAGTRTGRFSYSEPNLQNLPKEKNSNATYVVRGCFVPRPGRVFVSMDYAQQEYRIMLAYARQRDLIERVMAGADLHQATADLVGIDRDRAKTLNFAILYGAGPAKVAKMLGVEIDEAKALIAKYFEKLPRVEQFITDVISKAKARGYVWTWLGRKLQFAWRRFQDDDGEWQRFHDAYSAPNHICQGGGADVIKVAMVELERRGLITPACFPVVQIHDQLVFDCEPRAFDKLPEIARILEEAFPEKNGMRLKVDVSWSNKSLAERDLTKGYPWQTSESKATK